MNKIPPRLVLHVLCWHSTPASLARAVASLARAVTSLARAVTSLARAVLDSSCA